MDIVLAVGQSVSQVFGYKVVVLLEGIIYPRIQDVTRYKGKLSLKNEILGQLLENILNAHVKPVQMDSNKDLMQSAAARED